MIKFILKISFYAFITFCVVNFILLLVQIFFSSFTKELPEISIGNPLNFYRLYPNRNLNYATYLEWEYLFYNYILFWIIIFGYSNLKTLSIKTNNNKHKI